MTTINGLEMFKKGDMVKLSEYGLNTLEKAGLIIRATTASKVFKVIGFCRDAPDAVRVRATTWSPKTEAAYFIGYLELVEAVYIDG